MMRRNVTINEGKMKVNGMTKGQDNEDRITKISDFSFPQMDIVNNWLRQQQFLSLLLATFMSMPLRGYEFVTNGAFGSHLITDGPMMMHWRVD